MPETPRRRPKAPLHRDAVVAAALALVDEVGFAAVTMRRVAQALDTGAASLYVYLPDRDALLAAAYDLALAEVVLPGDADGGWRTRLELLVARTVAALGRHDDLAAMALTGPRTGRHALRVTEEVLRLLRSGGIGATACVWAADLIDRHVTSAALERAAWLRERRDRTATAGARLDAAIDALPPREFPTLHALRVPMTAAGDGATRPAWRLRVILDGILAQPAG